MSSFSQFIDGGPEYLHVNRLVDAMELFEVLRHGDGRAFDEHFGNMLVATGDPEFGITPNLITKLENDLGTKPTYSKNASKTFPESFALMQDILGHCSKDTFVELMLGPSAVQLPLSRRYGIELEHAQPPLESQPGVFSETHCVQFSRFIASPLLKELADQVARVPFKALHHASLGEDHTMDFGPTQAMLQYLITDARLVEQLEALCGESPGTLTRFTGRIYRMIPGRDADSFHNDVHLADKRLMAMSLSLTSETPKGGVLHLRRKNHLRCFHHSKPAELGGAIVFRISRHLQHKAGRVWRGSRTNLAGWFCAPEVYDYDRWVDRPLFQNNNPWRRLWARR